MDVVRRRIYITVAVLVCVMALLVAGVLLRLLNPDNTPQMERLGLISLREPVPLQSFEVKDGAGQPRSVDSFRQRWMVVYTSTSVCAASCTDAIQAMKHLQILMRDTVLASSTGFFVATPPHSEKDMTGLNVAPVDFLSTDQVAIDSERSILAFAEQLILKDSVTGSPIDPSMGSLVLINADAEIVGVFLPPFDARQMFEAYRLFRS